MRPTTWRQAFALADEAELVPEAAERLRMSELELFLRAYQAWFGRAATEREIAPFFARYRRRREVPFWVRHHLRRARAGELPWRPAPPRDWRTALANLLPERDRLGLWDVLGLILATGLAMHLMGF